MQKGQQRRRVGFLRFIERTITKFSRRSRKTVGKELYLDTDAGKVRALAYNLDRTDKLPLFVNIHGSGFSLGDAEMDDSFMVDIASKANVKILSIDYSLAPEAPFPTALNECYGVVKYAKEHATELGFDPALISVGGHSAGGNLSAAICLLETERKQLGLKALILDYPPLDIYTDPYDKPRPRAAIPPIIARHFDAAYSRNRVERKNPLVSPVYATVDQVRSFPPTLVITASQDSLCEEAEKFKDKLVEAGVAVTFKRFNAVHGFTYSGTPESVEARQMMIDHLHKYLQPGA